MPRTLRISEGAIRAAHAHLPSLQAATAEFARALARLDRAPKSKPKAKKPFRAPGIAELASGGAPAYVALKTWAEGRKTEKALAKARRQDIRTAVFLRATVDGTPLCEGPRLYSGPYTDMPRCTNPATQLQHVFGRGKGRRPESEDNCLASCGTCHRAETRNHPSGAWWWGYFAEWFDEHGLPAEAREARKFLYASEVKTNLPAAPKVNKHG